VPISHHHNFGITGAYFCNKSFRSVRAAEAVKSICPITSTFLPEEKTEASLDVDGGFGDGLLESVERLSGESLGRNLANRLWVD
jgi:hypothetical protein